jgi:pSer/pThr/pTyr-binding forkhead associated (FHA) protein
MSGVVVLILRILITATLYLFLAFLLYSVWNDIRKRTKKEGHDKPPLLRLEPLGASRKPIDIRDVNATIGRQKICEILVDDRSISGRHASLSFHENQWWIEDLHSKNGTYLNDAKVTHPTVCMDKDHLRCGGVEWEIQLSVELSGGKR